jgi:hypothetical protein
MAHHIATVESLFDSKTWVFYEGTQAELAIMRAWVEHQFPSDQIEIGTQDITSLVDFGIRDLYRQGFAFVRRNDAMRFKLSW